MVVSFFVFLLTKFFQMRHSFLLLYATLLIVSGCASKSSDLKHLISRINNEISEGNLEKAKSLTDSLKLNTDNELITRKADSLSQIIERIPVDFSVTEQEIGEQLKKRFGDNLLPDDIKKWEENGWLEYRVLNGEKRYFNRAVSNLMLLRNFHLDRQNSDSLAARDPRIVFRRKHTGDIIKSANGKTLPAEPVNVEIIYTITVNPDAVPEGEKVRCWLPFPKENNIRQTDVYLRGITDDQFFILAPDSVVHRSVYMEKAAVKGEPVVFQVAYSYTSSGQYFDPQKLIVNPYNKKSELYKKYTSEQLPQICFTENIKRLADSIAGAEENPYQIVRKIYYWFNRNIPWAGALEYSIMPNIPEYVLSNRRGDCGMQTFLFMSMLRYKGIPVKWQSGWMIPPEGKNLHDWCEVYYEGTGWVPVDISYNLQFSPDIRTREFYITGIDSYRLIINDGIAGNLYPEKKYLRSEPFDFQRGEVEWSGGNLYFDKWDYNMMIEYR
jgi:hypothetical protein